MPALGTDLLVVGGGKGGRTLAMDMARAGRRVAMVERTPQMIAGPAGSAWGWSPPPSVRRSLPDVPGLAEAGVELDERGAVLAHPTMAERPAAVQVPGSDAQGSILPSWARRRAGELTPFRTRSRPP